MNIWFVSQHEAAPVDENAFTRFNMMARKARDRGHGVTFWAPTFSHASKSVRAADDKGVTIEEGYVLELLKIKPYKKHISLNRLKANKMFAKKIGEAFNRYPSKPDVVMLSYPPMILAEYVSKWCEKNNVPLVADLIDPWPDSFLKLMKGYPKFLQNAILAKPRQNLRKTFKRTSAITGIAKARIEWARNYFDGEKRTEVFYPAIDLKKVTAFREQNKAEFSAKEKDVLTVIYAGSLGYSYDLPTIVKAAEELERRKSPVKVVIAGDGPQKKIVEEYAAKLDNLKYLGRIPKTQLLREYIKADCGLIQHFPKATQTVTYKVFDYMSNRLPLLNSLDSELWGMIEAKELGMNNESGDYKQLADNIESLKESPSLYKRLSDNALEYTKEEGDSYAVYGRTIDLLEELVNNNRGLSSEHESYI